jgi:hypothetical protein
MPDNSGYYHLAYIAAAAIYSAYAVTLYWRWARVRGKRFER